MSFDNCNKFFPQFNSSSTFCYETKQKSIKVQIVPLDEQIKQLLITIEIGVKKQQIIIERQQKKYNQNLAQDHSQQQQINRKRSGSLENGQQSQIIRYEEVFSKQDFFGYCKERYINKLKNTQQNKSLLWIKLLLQQYFSKIQAEFHSRQPQILTKSLIFTNKLYMKKVYHNQKTIQKMLNENSTQKNDCTSDNLAFANLFIDMKQAGYNQTILGQSFFLVIPRKIKAHQKLISKISIQQQKKNKHSKEIQDLFYDNKFIGQY